ncbi:UNVERIFIED_CONTAM: hypothetical protein K2H54_062381 [Gekko kuhli]
MPPYSNKDSSLHSSNFKCPSEAATCPTRGTYKQLGEHTRSPQQGNSREFLRLRNWGWVGRIHPHFLIKKAGHHGCHLPIKHLGGSSLTLSIKHEGKQPLDQGWMDDLGGHA